jgi:hypothetical protein
LTLSAREDSIGDPQSNSLSFYLKEWIVRSIKE